MAGWLDRWGAHRRTVRRIAELECETLETAAEEKRKREANDTQKKLAAQLGITTDQVESTGKTLPSWWAMSVLRLVGQKVADNPGQIVMSGLSDRAGPVFETFDLGEHSEQVPIIARLDCAPGTFAPCNLIMDLSVGQQGYYISINFPKSHRDDVTGVIDKLIKEAQDNSPFKGKLLNVANGRFEIVSSFQETRDDVIVPSSIWSEVDENVHNVFRLQDRLEQAGLGTNNGVLFWGPPGTGKTLLTKVIAAELAKRGITAAITGPGIVQSAMPTLYKEVARLAPAAIFIEDLDLLVGNREKGGARQALLEFLTVLDGLMTQKGLVTVASTNDVHAIDAAAIRAARFGAIVEVPYANLDARKLLIERYLRAVSNVDPEVDVELVARRIGDNHSGAEIRELVRKAVLKAVDKPITTHLLLAAGLSVGMIGKKSIGFRPGRVVDTTEEVVA